MRWEAVIQSDKGDGSWRIPQFHKVIRTNAKCHCQLQILKRRLAAPPFKMRNLRRFHADTLGEVDLCRSSFFPRYP
jgi:hypothetical protein